ncbi:MAG: IS110 family transposase [Desulfobacterales bacterium]|nr:IS110 family transposase [Desulfobacterales bacterium]
METYAGIDLHSSNNYIGIINEQDQKLFGKRLPNDLNSVLMALEPYKDTLKGVVVESTYNWYWLVDGLQEHGYPMHLANPSAIKQYEGMKHTDDKWDSFWLAHMFRLGILPQGYIYPKEQRHVRDLLRRRLLFVRQRTTQILSFQSMVARNLGVKMSVNIVKQLAKIDVQSLFDSPHLVLAAKSSIAAISFLTTVIKDIEKEVLSQVKLRDEFGLLQTIPGIGKILALTIMLEMDTIKRFEKVGNYSSYCRCVNSQRLSNGKKKGENNRKNGNKYLAWAYVEAANFAVRYNEKAKRFYQQKKSKRNGIVAIKALSNKIARASYYMLRDQVPFDENRLFC